MRGRSPSRLALAMVAALALLLAGGCGGDVQTPAKPKPLRHYVALGDTFAAAPYTGKTSSEHGCRRSKDNYPAQLANALKVKSFTDVTCTGADILAATRKTKVDGHQLDRQIDAVKKSTDLVTVQFGAYFEGLYDKVADMCKPDSEYKCRLSKVAGSIAAVTARLRALVANVVRKTGTRAPHATIVVVGYPRHVDADSHCPAISTTNRADRKEWTTLDEGLNLAASQGARDTGVDFVDVYAASKKHGICDKVPWVRPSTTSHSRGIAFGPTAAGQEAVAKLIRRTLRSDRHLDLG